MRPCTTRLDSILWVDFQDKLAAYVMFVGLSFPFLMIDRMFKVISSLDLRLDIFDPICGPV